MQRIAVIGAGVAGLAVAAGLHRAGLECAVYEQAAELTAVGAGIQLSPNATRLLERLGVLAGLHPVAVAPTAIRMRRWQDGRDLSRTALGDDCENRYGAPYLCVHRADLLAALRSAVPPQWLRLGRRCMQITEREDQVELVLADGSTAPADLVIGADGIRSLVRSHLVTDRPRFTGQFAYRALVPLARPRPDPEVTIWVGPGQHFVCYPISGGRQLSIAATVPGSAGPEPESWQWQARTQELLDAYQGWAPEVRAIAAAVQSPTRWALHDRDPVGRWHSERLVLVGDSAHPMLPFGAQGAAQGLEDAAALVTCLSEAPEVAGALPLYRRVREPRAGAVVDYVRGNARDHHVADGAEQRERDARMPDRRGLEALDWLYRYDAHARVRELIHEGEHHDGRDREKQFWT